MKEVYQTVECYQKLKTVDPELRDLLMAYGKSKSYDQTIILEKLEKYNAYEKKWALRLLESLDINKSLDNFGYQIRN